MTSLPSTLRLEDDVSGGLSRKGNPMIYNAIFIERVRRVLRVGREGTGNEDVDTGV